MKHLSLTENHLFGKAYSGGQRSAGKYTAVYVLRDKAAKRLMVANPQKEYLNRVGLSVSKRVGGAVVRSRVRRVLREGFRAVENENKLKTGFIIVIAARGAAADAKSTDIARELRYALRRLGLIEKNEGEPSKKI